MKAGRIMLAMARCISLAMPAFAQEEAPAPPDAAKIEALLFKRFPGMNRVLWLNDNAIEFGNRKGASPHKKTETCLVAHHPPRVLKCTPGS